MSADPPLPPGKLEVRRTIPELRKAIREFVLGYIGQPVDDFFITGIDRLLEETKRRSPKWPVARKKDPDPDPQIILAIRKYKTENPSAHTKDMSLMFDTSTRCISFALVGKRDGSPVYDDRGQRIRKPPTRGSAPDEEEEPAKGDWE